MKFKTLFKLVSLLQPSAAMSKKSVQNLRRDLLSPRTLCFTLIRSDVCTAGSCPVRWHPQHLSCSAGAPGRARAEWRGERLQNTEGLSPPCHAFFFKRAKTRLGLSLSWKTREVAGMPTLQDGVAVDVWSAGSLVSLLLQLSPA